MQAPHGIPPYRDNIASQASSTCTRLKGRDNSLLIGNWPTAEFGVDENNDEVHILDPDVGNLKLFHSQNYRRFPHGVRLSSKTRQSRCAARKAYPLSTNSLMTGSVLELK
jgi:hypothetical protein